MIESRVGDILSADTEALVNTVNCVGVMGRGVALQFRKAFPSNFEVYKAACSRGEVVPGRMLVVELPGLDEPHYVINFPTKRHWRGKSRLEDIEAGLGALVDEVGRRGIRSVAVPPLGCGLGGLQWGIVRPLIAAAFAELPSVRVIVYEPEGPPAQDEMVTDRERPAMTAGRAALLALARQYLAAAMDTRITLLEVHKLLYFMQEAGEPLRLRFARGPYGPYAENLRHVLNRIEGHFLRGYGDGEDAPHRQLEVDERACGEALTFLADHTPTLQRFEQVRSLIEGFETPYGMELLSTVHWLGRREAVPDHEALAAQVYAWNSRKRQFPRDHIRLAWDVLVTQGWLAGECPTDASARPTSRRLQS